MPLTRIRQTAIGDDTITAAKLAPNITDSGTGHTQVAKGTTLQRSSGVTGMLRYNTTVEVLEQFTNDSGWVGIEPAPTMSAIVYPNSQTAAAEGDTITINGSGFKSGVTVAFISGSSTPATTTTRVSSAQLTAEIPALAEGTYTVQATNPSGLAASLENGITIDGLPVFSTASGSLGTFDAGDSVSVTIAATEDSAAITSFAVKTGYSLPSGLSLNSSTGVISGSLSAVDAETTTQFYIVATDAENQTSERLFSITTRYASLNALIFED
jgi:hypothetical protein